MSAADEPIHPIHGTMGLPKSFGLTKREYFAAMAMQGMLADGNYGFHKEIAEGAAAMADALIAALERKPE